jgi:hypothetical protein
MDIGHLFEGVCRSLLARLDIVTVFDRSILSGTFLTMYFSLSLPINIPPPSLR